MNCVFDFQLTKLMPLLAVEILDPISICHGVHGVCLILENCLMPTVAFQLHAYLGKRFFNVSLYYINILDWFFPINLGHRSSYI
jgi:hypothetical protein